jgi:two-component system phosphate regulon sensor histidine kinase PhoR
MKRSAGIASFFIFLFFISFNGLQVYLICERITEAKNKFGAACSASLLFTLSEYHKLKAIDSASTPTHAWIAYAAEKIDITRGDSQHVTLSVPASSLLTDSVEPVFIENILNSGAFETIDLPSFDTIFKKTLSSKDVRAGYRLDTITITGKKFDRQQIPVKWAQKRRKDYAFSTNPVRMPYNSNILVFADIQSDPAFIRNDLLWPMLAFAFILLIGNTALLFVFSTIRKQRKINELKTDFINNISHEMKTPITIASAGLQALELHVPPTERTDFYLHTSKRQLHQLNDFVERIVDAAVTDISDFTLKKEKLDLHALLNDLVLSHSLLHGESVKFQVTGKGPAFIDGDPLHLETAFHNIIDNAIKYSNGSVNIRIEMAETHGDCLVKIRDNGMGIPPQFIKNIFEKFFRVPQGDAQSIKGFGLGLYYVNSIVRKHGGTISVQSKPQSGTEFTITLPKSS